MIKRETYLEKLRGYKDKHIIKVITGVRRCGKSTLLEMFREELQAAGVNESQIIYINFEDMDFIDLHEAKELHSYIKDKLNDDRCYVFLDEIQLVNNFERVIDSLFLNKNVDIYVTGSNANMLSGELATLLSGRYVEIEMLPLSFSEFASAFDDDASKSDLYRRYLEYSSFPYVLELGTDKSLVRGYLEGVFNTVVLKDIVARKKVSDVLMLESVIRFLFDSIGAIVSMRKISDTMTSNGRKISVHTVESYIHGLMDSYILYQAKRYDIKGKQHLKTLEKYYMVDIGLRYYLLGQKNIDYGRVLENIIYLELIRRDFDVYVGKVDQYEVDFVAVNQIETLYVQVAATVREKATLERELRSLRAIKDHNQKVLLTLDNDPEANYEGIRVINALDWLLG